MELVSEHKRNDPNDVTSDLQHESETSTEINQVCRREKVQGFPRLFMRGPPALTVHNQALMIEMASSFLSGTRGIPLTCCYPTRTEAEHKHPPHTLLSDGYIPVTNTEALSATHPWSD